MNRIIMAAAIVLVLGCVSPATPTVTFDASSINQQFEKQTGVCVFGTFQPLSDFLIHVKMSDNPQLDQTLNGITQPTGKKWTLTDTKGKTHDVICYTQSAYPINTIKYVSCANEIYCAPDKAPVAFLVEYGNLRNAQWIGNEIRPI